MDQYVVNFNLSMLYIDMVRMIDLLKESGDEMMFEYAEVLQDILNEEGLDYERI